MEYRYKEYTFYHEYGKGKLFKGDTLLFKGNAWSGILQFINVSNNAPEVQEMFKTYLEHNKKYQSRYMEINTV